tara:strand:+ start:30 stop:248 length:219 start_codon:yes stop_codon:yes gene_type:complete
MKEEASQLIETIASHPKTALAVAAVSNANVWWLDYGEPAIKGLTSVLGLVILSLLIVKHSLDIKKEHFTKKD